MALRTLVVAAVLGIATQVLARAPAPLLPTALVEDVKSITADVEFMDYVGRGQVIKLEPEDVLVLSYLKSCEREIITGGSVTVGAERSDVRDGRVVRTKVPCDDGKILTPQQANQSAASSFRLQNANIRPTLYGRTPMVRLPKLLGNEDRTLLIERVDRPGERYELRIDDAVVTGGFYDLAKSDVKLSQNAVYEASIGTHKMAFRIDPKAKSGDVPIVSRLLRFQ